LKRDITLIFAQGVAGDTNTNAYEDPMKYICTVMLAAARLKPTYGLHQNKVNFDQTTALGMSNEANLDMFDTWNELY